ncbi:hypothetical protein OLK001_17970 [Synechocystis sp. LKSZ1]
MGYRPPGILDIKEKFDKQGTVPNRIKGTTPEEESPMGIPSIFKTSPATPLSTLAVKMNLPLGLRWDGKSRTCIEGET